MSAKYKCNRLCYYDDYELNFKYVIAEEMGGKIYEMKSKPGVLFVVLEWEAEELYKFSNSDYVPLNNGIPDTWQEFVLTEEHKMKEFFPDTK